MRNVVEERRRDAHGTIRVGVRLAMPGQQPFRRLVNEWKHHQGVAGDSRRQNRAAHRPQDLAFELAEVPVPVSEDYLAKIVDELVHNAFKFSQAGTKVQVSLADAQNAEDARSFMTHQRGRHEEDVRVRRKEGPPF